MNAAYLIIALPLAGFAVNIAVGRRIGNPLAGWLATLASAGAFAATVVCWMELRSRPDHLRSVDKHIFSWMHVAGLHVNFGLRVDDLSILMALFVTGVGSLIHMYSIGYMEHDPDFSRFFMYLNLFLFSMVVLVLADNYLFMFLGWEGVGFCSYGLVGFWFERNSAAVAAKKAFVTNRVGDVGFILAIFLMFQHFHSVDYNRVLNPLMGGQAGSLTSTTATAICLLLLLGAAGKSAQLPLYMWLPDAMEGPTPVSALIHAATMVTAGVYLMCRSVPLLHLSHSAQWTVAIVGAATAAFAATIACAQDDIKRILAYSTLSQLGYMFLAVGCGGYQSGLFHMITHAFFKALLFLSAGSVIHSLHDQQDVKKMGGLFRYIKFTSVAFIIGALAISGIPPLAGFWSKDDVLDAAWHMNKGLWVVGALTAMLTAYYMFREVMLVFFGDARWKENRPLTEVADHAGAHDMSHDEPHESPWTMALPNLVLSILAIVGGVINLPYKPWNALDRWLEPVFPKEIAPPIDIPTHTKVDLSLIVVGLCVVGVLFGVFAWRQAQRPRLEPALLAHGWYVDEALAKTVDGPIRADAEWLAFGVDSKLVDGTVGAMTESITGSGRVLRKLQTGYVRSYALAMGVGVVGILLYAAFRVGG